MARGQRGMLSGALHRMMHRSLSLAFEKWQSAAAEMKEEARKLRQGVMRLVAGKMAAAFGTWREAASQRKAAMELCGRCARRMRNACLSAAWNSWRSAAAMARGQRGMVSGKFKATAVKTLHLLKRVLSAITFFSKLAWVAVKH